MEIGNPEDTHGWAPRQQGQRGLSSPAACHATFREKSVHSHGWRVWRISHTRRGNGPSRLQDESKENNRNMESTRPPSVPLVGWMDGMDG